MLKERTVLIEKLFNKVLSQPRQVKTLIAIFVDFICCIFSVWFSYYLRIGNLLPLNERGIEALIISIVLIFPIFIYYGAYKNILRFSGIYALINFSKVITIYGAIYSFIFVVVGIEGVPRTIGIIQPLLILLLVSFWRILVKSILTFYQRGDHKLKIRNSRALVYGSGNAGMQLVRAMQESSEIKIVGFLDDNKKQNGCLIDGITIYSPKLLKDLIKEKNVNLILLAMPSIPRKRRIEIIRNLMKYKIAVRTIPTISELANGKSSITELNDLEMDELLGRMQVDPFQELMMKNISSKTILVTGAGGSIGSELCRQIISLKPSRLLLVEISEYALYSIYEELKQTGISELEIIPLIGSVQDPKRMKEILKIWKPETIYHAAAYKHVPIVEHNLIEGLKNNVFGTYVLAKIALDYKVENFVFISTDKAVRPTSIMGATKRLAELILQALNNRRESFSKNDKTIFSIVRFGNVLDSSGSVIPKFRKQIRDRVPITLTHPEISRYFMTINEAAELVIQASSMSKGGDVFLLDMGESVKILDLAKKMINLSGLKLKEKNCNDGDIEIKITGLRHGEKLYEELLIGNNSELTKHPKIFRAKEDFLKWPIINSHLIDLEKYISDNDSKNIITILQKIISGYKPSEIILGLFSEGTIEK